LPHILILRHLFKKEKFMIVTATLEDGPQIHRINAGTVIFTAEETATVDELFEEYLSKGPEASGYHFIVEKQDDVVLGYACYGPHALADRVYDLYWIAVDLEKRGGGVGKIILKAAEEGVRSLGGRILVLETSGLPEYASTRAFYLATGYTLEATLKDFYKDGDDLVFFTKRL
jgi:GNAT superfamily N-acetyltransferase